MLSRFNENFRQRLLLGTFDEREEKDINFE